MWLRDGEQITVADGYDIVVDGTKHKLVIRRASLDDEAEYTVMVGNNESSTLLLVEGKFWFTCFCNVLSDHVGFRTGYF